MLPEDLNRYFMCRIKDIEVNDALNRIKTEKVVRPNDIPIKV